MTEFSLVTWTISRSSWPGSLQQEYLFCKSFCRNEHWPDIGNCSIATAGYWTLPFLEELRNNKQWVEFVTESTFSKVWVHILYNLRWTFSFQFWSVLGLHRLLKFLLVWLLSLYFTCLGSYTEEGREEEMLSGILVVRFEDNSGAISTESVLSEVWPQLQLRCGSLHIGVNEWPEYGSLVLVQEYRL